MDEQTKIYLHDLKIRIGHDVRIAQAMIKRTKPGRLHGLNQDAAKEISSAHHNPIIDRMLSER